MVERISYRGWDNAWRLSNGTVELIVLADVGPRIVRYGFCGAENILYEVSREVGLTGGAEFRLYGGHRLWAWPEVARTYFPDNNPVSVRPAGETVRFTGPMEDSAPGTHLQKQFEVTLDAAGTRVHIAHTITNRGTASTELAVWCPTMMRVGGSAILPLPPRRRNGRRALSVRRPTNAVVVHRFSRSALALGHGFYSVAPTTEA